MALLHSLRAIYLHEGEIEEEDVQLPEAGGSDNVRHNLSNLLDISSLEVLASKPTDISSLPFIVITALGRSTFPLES